MPDNLADFMTDQLKKLPDQTQRVLRIASCIGNRFDLHTLAMVNEKPPRETAGDLWEALQEGLIMPLDDGYKLVESPGDRQISYRFLHDRVQQAAYSMLDDHKKKVLHLSIGRLLFGNTRDHLEENAFHIVNQLNFGISLISSPGERTNLAQLNLVVESCCLAGGGLKFLGESVT